MSAHGCIGSPCVICHPQLRPAGAPLVFAPPTDPHPLDTAVRALFELGAHAVVFTLLNEDRVQAYASLPDDDGVGTQAASPGEAAINLVRVVVRYIAAPPSNDAFGRDVPDDGAQR